MAAEKQLTEQESLELITEMLQKAKGHFHTSGVSAILWGSVVGIAGIVSYLQLAFGFYIGFDVWLIVMAAIIPQIIISIRESRQRKVLTHQESFLNVVWAIYSISIFALVFYNNVVPGVLVNELATNGQVLLVKNTTTGELANWTPRVSSASSLFLILYAIPTLATGITCKVKPMIAGGILCYVFFIISCFTPTKYDHLMNGVAGIVSWLIPGILLRMRYSKVASANV